MPARRFLWPAVLRAKERRGSTLSLARRTAGPQDVCWLTPSRCPLPAADAAEALQYSPPTSSTPLLPARACRCCRHDASARVWHGCHRTPDTPSPTHLARPARSPLTMRVPRRRRTQLALTSAHSPPPRSLDGETHARRAPARGRRTRPATPPRRVCARYQRAQQPHRRQAPVLSVLV